MFNFVGSKVYYKRKESWLFMVARLAYLLPGEAGRGLTVSLDPEQDRLVGRHPGAAQAQAEAGRCSRLPGNHGQVALVHNYYIYLFIF